MCQDKDRETAGGQDTTYTVHYIAGDVLYSDIYNKKEIKKKNT